LGALNPIVHWGGGGDSIKNPEDRSYLEEKIDDDHASRMKVKITPPSSLTPLPPEVSPTAPSLLAHQPLDPALPMHMSIIPPIPTPQDLEFEMMLFQLKAQLEYYFSVENLCKDTFLRSIMNSEGFVPLEIVANFNRVKYLNGGDLNFLVQAASMSPHLQVKKIFSATI